MSVLRPRLRRCAVEPGVQGSGVGLAKLGRRHHRRGAGGQDRQGPWHRRTTVTGVGLPDEEPARAAARRHRARAAHSSSVSVDSALTTHDPRTITWYPSQTRWHVRCVLSDDNLTGLDRFACWLRQSRPVSNGHCLRSQAGQAGAISALRWGVCAAGDCTAADRTPIPGTHRDRRPG